MATAPKCVVVDDEPEIRTHVARLARANGLTVVGQAANSAEALDLVQHRRPDILFLDIRMPGSSGLELLTDLQSEPEPPVPVLVTAYGEHALAAFELAAIDYIMKPIDRERFALATQRAIEQAQSRQAVATLERLRAACACSRPDVLSFRDGSGIVRLRPADVIRFAAMDDYVEAWTGRRSFLLSVRLSAVTNALPSPPFLQVHRSHLINIDRVARMSIDGGRMSLLMDDGTVVPVSRSRAADVKRQVDSGSLEHHPPVRNS